MCCDGGIVSAAVPLNRPTVYLLPLGVAVLYGGNIFTLRFVITCKRKVTGDESAYTSRKQQLRSMNTATPDTHRNAPVGSRVTTLSPGLLMFKYTFRPGRLSFLSTLRHKESSKLAISRICYV